jgi:hypothetical protein
MDNPSDSTAMKMTKILLPLPESLSRARESLNCNGYGIRRDID